MGRLVEEGWHARVAAGAAVASVGACLATVALVWWGARSGVGAADYLPTYLVFGLLYPPAGAVVLRRQPGNAAGWILVFAGLLGVTALAHQWAHHGVVVGRDGLPLVDVATWLSAWTIAPFFVVPALLPLLFPDGRLPAQRWRPLVVAVLALATVGTLAAAFAPDPDVEGLGLANPLGVGPEGLLPAFEAAVVVAGVASFLVAGPVGVATLVARQRRAVGRQRAQLQWLLLGFIVALALMLPDNAVGGSAPTTVLFVLGAAAVPAAIVIAVVRHGLFDIEVVVNRAIVYGLLTAAGFLAYLILVALVSGRWVSDTQVAPLIAAGVAFAAALGRERLQGWVDRRLFGARSDPFQVTERIGATVEISVAPGQALVRLVEAVREALALPFAAVEPVVAGAPEASAGRAVAETEQVPVVVAGRQVAVLRVGHRHRGERFRTEERAALADVARRAGAVIQAAMLAEDLQASRERIVVTQEEERRRLRRELHDGVGPALAGMALQVDGLTRRLDDQPTLAARAERLQDGLAGTVAEIRRIVDGLRPAPVDELGLAEALRQLAVGEDAGLRVEVDAQGNLPVLPAAVEAAAYRIASEALANSLRHSGARHCRISAASDGDRLLLEVADDGCGFGADAVAGVGLQSMHERAHELGGEVDVDSTPGAGTVVRARLPLEPA